MSKYDKLWEYVEKQEGDELVLANEMLERIDANRKLIGLCRCLVDGDEKAGILLVELADGLRHVRAPHRRHFLPRSRESHAMDMYF